MPKLDRSEWYDLARDMNWQFKYVRDTEVFPEALSESKGIPPKAWWNWDEPYKISYRDYVKNQAEKESGVYTVRSALARSGFFENLDPGWKAAIIAHYGVFAMPEYLAAFGEARMGRFGRAAAWRIPLPVRQSANSCHCSVAGYDPETRPSLPVSSRARALRR